jgi:hypothetical protein
MAYTVGLMIFDLDDIYGAGFPAFTGVLSELPPLTAPLVATSTPASPLTLPYPSASGPPSSPGTLGLLHVTDPAGRIRQ